MDIEVWEWTVRKKGVVVQEAMDPQVTVILGINVLQELDQQIAWDLGPLYWKGSISRVATIAALRKILHQCRT